MTESEITGFAVSESTFRISHHQHFINEKKGEISFIKGRHII